MKKSRLFLLVAIVLVSALALTACGGGSNTDSGENGDQPKTTVLKAGHTLAPDHPYNDGMLKFAELVEQKTNGQIKIDVYPAAQLGSEREAIEGVQMGTIDITLVSTAPLAGFSDAFLALDLPFIFKDRTHAYKVLDGEIGQDMLSKLDGTGLIGINFWENGFRNLTNGERPVVVPEDAKGLKVRTMENQIHMDSFRAIGADPTPMAFGELFTALQQKTVDGQENPLPIIWTSKFFEVQEHLALTGHFYAAVPLLINEKLFNSFSPEVQQAILEAAEEARDFERNIIKEMDESLLGDLKEAGMQVTEPDKAVWEEAMKSVYDKYESKIGTDLIQKIKQAAN
ncbi:MAG: TRAP transporter substrate-binding protein [Bacillota bacterium]|nr:TRAP transporter substrate-binding protein [Bacillota bacterium]